jgi:hypothetical protein
MTEQDEIIAMARMAHLDVYGLGKNQDTFASMLERFAKLVEQRKVNEIANACERLPFGDTSQSFAVWIREQA